ncbi:hypothetical protein JMN32_02590 [Fulvivirga sp. 29W222]|uniref:Leucine-rich repeat domain-containing protein n=1 Tax=Fulvivirga marina TaxID=2494733 RepID=A0A937FVE0_9BACT|nr:leucine-rich repeat domain-containing protein [Fulvivirga marina]MBL6445178.1 hypothetical protein [Fulvivirga marina]
MRLGAVSILMIAMLLSSINIANAQSDEEKVKVSELMKFLEFTLNTLGDPEVAVGDKKTITDQSYLKIFQDENVQIEDDLSERKVSINKNIQSYLQDVDILFKEVKFQFDISKIEKHTTAAQKDYFKVTFMRTITGTSADGEKVENASVRYAEINYAPTQQVYKVASIYSSGIRDMQTFQTWWDGLNFEWKVVFQRAVGSTVTPSESHKVMGIKKIDISYNKYITDLKPLAKLTALEILNFSSTGVNDISILSQLSNLREVYMSNTGVQSLEPLKALESLEVVYFENTAVTSLTPIAPLKSLKKVVCINTPIDLSEIRKFEETNQSCKVLYETADLMNWWNNLPLAWKESFKEQFSIATTPPTGEDLARIKSAEKIDIEGKYDIYSLDPIADLSNVKFLNLKKSGVTSLEPLKKWSSLERLDLSDTHVDSLGPVNSLSLKLLVADYSKVSKEELARYEAKHPSTTVIYKTMDFTIWWIKLSEEWRDIFAKSIGYIGPTDKLPLKNLYQILELKKLVIPEGSEIENITPLASLKNLRELKVSKVMKISDLSPLSNLTKLESLDCSYNPVVDLTPLIPLKSLKTLNIEYTRVSDLDPLSEIVSLESLHVSGTKINNINAVRRLSNLKEISLQNTSVSNLSPLFTLIHLEKVSCYNTKLSQKDVNGFKNTKPSCDITFY